MPKGQFLIFFLPKGQIGIRPYEYWAFSIGIFGIGLSASVCKGKFFTSSNVFDFSILHFLRNFNSHSKKMI